MANPNRNLNILCWNATGIMSSSTYLCNILNEKAIDICGISEHWLYEKDLYFLNEIDNNYHSYAVSDAALSLPGRRRVGKGGVAILWHKRHDHNISPLNLEDDRIIGVKYICNSECAFYFFQMYLPCSNHSMAAYTEYIDRLRNILYLYSERGIVVLLGDMNANLLPSALESNISGRSLHLMNFLQENNLISLNTLEFCTGAKSSFVSYDSSCESLIDHILFPIDKLCYVKECEICDDACLNVSRHRPIYCCMQTPVYQLWPSYRQCDININWRKTTDVLIDDYKERLSNNEVLQSLVNNEIITVTEVDQAYSTLVTEVKSTAVQCFPIKRYKHYLKPYWNDELNTLHKDMKQKRAVWISNGKPRGDKSLSYNTYKAAKRQFRKKHRNVVDAYLKNKIDEIDSLAEVDSNMFWRLVNARRKKPGSSPGSEINFDGKIACSPQEITNEWAMHFQKLYTPSDDIHFDDEHKYEITRQLQIINDNLEVSVCPLISAEEVQAAVQLGKRGKAAGEDGISYEHIAFGGQTLIYILSNLFTAMLKLSYAPDDLKKGVIITLFKGGNKRKDDPDNYRAITLSSVILKLFERILLTRIQLFDNIQPPIHPLQGGFQKHFGCLMTSFMLRESINFAKENGSRLYVCFLDVRKAFDCVWHDGLFYKLYKCGIDKAIFKILQNLYTGMRSCVRFQGCKSEWFPILQGTRQGGVISPFLYLVFLNDLLYQLEASGLGMCFYNIDLSCPTVADDMLVQSFSKIGLEELISICVNYAYTWRFLHSASKSAVVVFNEKKSDFLRTERSWKLGNDYIPEKEQYKHLGILCDKYMAFDKVTTEACRKIKGTFLSIVNCGLHDDELNPITSMRIYNSVVLPKALYGCELWSRLLPNEILSLERAHRFCIKFMQCLPRSTSTDVALALLGSKSIEVEIDRRKLIFLEQLCNLPSHLRVKEFFIHRMVSFDKNSSSQLGFIPDIFRLLGKYSLTSTLHTFLEIGSFMTKNAWKRLLRDKFLNVGRDTSLQRVSNSESFSRFMDIHSLDKPYILYDISKESRKYLKNTKLAVRLLGLMFSGKKCTICRSCGELSQTLTEHILLFCTACEDFRNKLWENMISRFGIKFFNSFIALSPAKQVDNLFAGCHNLLQTENEIKECLKIFLASLTKINNTVSYSVIV